MEDEHWDGSDLGSGIESVCRIVMNTSECRYGFVDKINAEPDSSAKQHSKLKITTDLT